MGGWEVTKAEEAEAKAKNQGGGYEQRSRSPLFSKSFQVTLTQGYS